MELLEFFPKCLEEACSFRPVVLMLDSLDQLPADEGGRRLDWLPAKIPDDFYLIMSTLPDAEYECLPRLKVASSSCFALASWLTPPTIVVIAHIPWLSAYFII